MLKVEKLNKSFRTPAGDVHAVKDVSFSTNSGQVVAIIGASGSGKSTLLSLVGLLDTPDSGSIDVNGAALASLSAAVWKKGRIALGAAPAMASAEACVYLL